MMNVWWNYTIVSCVSNISDKFEYPTFDSIVFWYQLNPRKLQILMKNHDAEGIDFLRTKKVNGKRKIETTPREDYDTQVWRHASKRKLKKATQSENDMITQIPDAVSDDDDDDDVDEENIVTANNVHKKISAEYATNKQKSEDGMTPVNDNSDGTDETGTQADGQGDAGDV